MSWSWVGVLLTTTLPLTIYRGKALQQTGMWNQSVSKIPKKELLRVMERPLPPHHHHYHHHPLSAWWNGVGLTVSWLRYHRISDTFISGHSFLCPVSPPASDSTSEHFIFNFFLLRDWNIFVCEGQPEKRWETSLRAINTLQGTENYQLSKGYVSGKRIITLIIFPPLTLYCKGAA